MNALLNLNAYGPLPGNVFRMSGLSQSYRTDRLVQISTRVLTRDRSDFADSKGAAICKL
jgi:hypothetical protein